MLGDENWGKISSGLKMVSSVGLGMLGLRRLQGIRQWGSRLAYRVSQALVGVLCTLWGINQSLLVVEPRHVEWVYRMEKEPRTEWGNTSIKDWIEEKPMEESKKKRHKGKDNNRKESHWSCSRNVNHVLEMPIMQIPVTMLGNRPTPTTIIWVCSLTGPQTIDRSWMAIRT